MIVNPLTATASELQAQLSNNSITSRQLVDVYLSQIARHNDYLKAVIATTPKDHLYKAATQLDDERQNGKIRGPLHGIPILVKDNIISGPDLGLPTTCGSLALVGSEPRKNAAVIERLLAAGAIILGKANLSEWAWYKSKLANSGWSAVGGQGQSAYVRGGFRDDDSNGGHSNCGGSSSGSAVSVAAGFSPISLGTETIGSLIMPSDRSALYTIKPTLKIVPQDGVIPISFEADSVGPMTKSVLDLANLLDVLVDPNTTKIPHGGYKSAVTGSWGDIRIGFVEPEKWLFPHFIVKYEEQATAQMLREWSAAMEMLKTVVKVVKPITLISFDEALEGGDMDIWNAFHYNFSDLLEEYLQSIDGAQIQTLKDLVRFNEEHADEELNAFANHNQDGLLAALNCNMTKEEYNRRLKFSRHACGEMGIDKALADNEIDVIIGPGDGAMFAIAGNAGYPVASLPLGYLDFNGRPFGMQVTAKAHEDALLVQVQSAWEATFPPRQPPSLDEINPSPGSA